MYRLTRKKVKQNSICQRMREGRARKLATRAHELGPRNAIYQPPTLRRVVIVIDFDHGPRVDVFKLARSHRIDRYQVTHNQAGAVGMGWANFCKRLSGHYPRLTSPMALEY